MLPEDYRFFIFNNSGVAISTSNITLGVKWWKMTPAGTLTYSGQKNLQNAAIISDGGFGAIGATQSNSTSLFFGGHVETQIFVAGSPTLNATLLMHRSTDGGAIVDDNGNGFFLGQVPTGGGAGTKIKVIEFG